jgi:DNA-binding MarR family transcriptional regulator
MTRDELFEYIQKIDDPVKDFSKIISNLHYTHFNLMDSYKKTLSTYDLTPIQANVLGIIQFKHPQPQSLEQIKDMVLEPGSDVSRTVLRLSEKGFVKKVNDPNNHRKLAIKATPKGLKIAETIAKDSSFQKATTSLTLQEARTFIKVLQKLRTEK